MIRVVSPYRPFVPESDEHQSLGPFDWIGALRMCRTSTLLSSPDTEWSAITDIDTTLPVPSLRFKTTERRLMLWILDVAWRYLKSPFFDCDTVMVSPDCLVLRDLRPWFTESAADIGVVIRTEEKHRGTGRVILNSVQFWRHEAKKKLATFYREALAIARTLPDEIIVWGADTEPLRQLLEPIEVGIWPRAGLTADLMSWQQMLEPLTTEHKRQLETGDRLTLYRPVLDFRATRKHWQRPAFDSLFGAVNA